MLRAKLLVNWQLIQFSQTLKKECSVHRVNADLEPTNSNNGRLSLMSSNKTIHKEEVDK